MNSDQKSTRLSPLISTTTAASALPLTASMIVAVPAISIPSQAADAVVSSSEAVVSPATPVLSPLSSEATAVSNATSTNISTSAMTTLTISRYQPPLSKLVGLEVKSSSFLKIFDDPEPFGGDYLNSLALDPRIINPTKEGINVGGSSAASVGSMSTVTPLTSASLAVATVPKQSTCPQTYSVSFVPSDGLMVLDKVFPSFQHISFCLKSKDTQVKILDFGFNMRVVDSLSAGDAKSYNDPADDSEARLLLWYQGKINPRFSRIVDPGVRFSGSMLNNENLQLISVVLRPTDNAKNDNQVMNTCRNQNGSEHVELVKDYSYDLNFVVDVGSNIADFVFDEKYTKEMFQISSRNRVNSTIKLDFFDKLYLSAVEARLLDSESIRADRASSDYLFEYFYKKYQYYYQYLSGSLQPSVQKFLTFISEQRKLKKYNFNEIIEKNTALMTSLPRLALRDQSELAKFRFFTVMFDIYMHMLSLKEKNTQDSRNDCYVLVKGIKARINSLFSAYPQGLVHEMNAVIKDFDDCVLQVLRVDYRDAVRWSEKEDHSRVFESLQEALEATKYFFVTQRASFYANEILRCQAVTYFTIVDKAVRGRGAERPIRLSTVLKMLESITNKEEQDHSNLSAIRSVYSTGGLDFIPLNVGVQLGSGAVAIDEATRKDFLETAYNYLVCIDRDGQSSISKFNVAAQSDEPFSYSWEQESLATLPIKKKDKKSIVAQALEAPKKNANLENTNSESSKQTDVNEKTKNKPRKKPAMLPAAVDEKLLAQQEVDELNKLKFENDKLIRETATALSEIAQTMQGIEEGSSKIKDTFVEKKAGYVQRKEAINKNYRSYLQLKESSKTVDLCKELNNLLQGNLTVINHLLTDLQRTLEKHQAKKKDEKQQQAASLPVDSKSTVAVKNNNTTKKPNKLQQQRAEQAQHREAHKKKLADQRKQAQASSASSSSATKNVAMTSPAKKSAISVVPLKQPSLAVATRVVSASVVQNFKNDEDAKVKAFGVVENAVNTAVSHRLLVKPGELTARQRLGLQQKHVGLAFESFMSIKKCLLQFEADILPTNSSAATYKKIRHRALLYYILTFSESCKKYKLLGGGSSAEINTEELIVLRNMMVHHGAGWSEEDSVLKTAEMLCNKMPAEFNKMYQQTTTHSVNRVLKLRQQKQLLEFFGLEQELEKKAEEKGATTLLANTPLYLDLAGLHYHKVMDEVSIKKCSDDLFKLWLPEIHEIMARIRKVYPDIYFQLSNIKRLQTDYPCHVEALTMLMTSCGELFFYAKNKAILPAGINANAETIFYEFVFLCKEIRNEVAHGKVSDNTIRRVLHGCDLVKKFFELSPALLVSGDSKMTAVAVSAAGLGAAAVAPSVYGLQAGMPGLFAAASNTVITAPTVTVDNKHSI